MPKPDSADPTPAAPDVRTGHLPVVTVVATDKRRIEVRLTWAARADGYRGTVDVELRVEWDAGGAPIVLKPFGRSADAWTWTPADPARVRLPAASPPRGEPEANPVFVGRVPTNPTAVTRPLPDGCAVATVRLPDGREFSGRSGPVRA